MMGGNLIRSATALVTLGLVLSFAIPPAVAQGVVGPNPVVNGDFSTAVAGTPLAAGWYVGGTAAGDPIALFQDVDGDIKLETSGKTGFFGGPTNLGSGFERAPTSALFDRITLEVTDTQGQSLAGSGMTVMLLVEHWVTTDTEERTSKAIRWVDVSTAEAASGLTLDNYDDVITFDGKPLPFDYTDEELANEFTMGGIKISLGTQQLHLDDINIEGAVLFGTYQ